MLPVLGPRDYRALMSNLKSKDVYEAQLARKIKGNGRQHLGGRDFSRDDCLY
jgi:hypothetical protein